MCVFLFGKWCHRNDEGAASDLELLINLALPHVTEQIAAGLSDASRRREHRLSRLCEDINNIFITPKLTIGAPQSPKNEISEL